MSCHWQAGPDSLTKQSLLTLSSSTSTGTDWFEAINMRFQKRRSRLIVLINFACEVSPNPAQEGAGMWALRSLWAQKAGQAVEMK